MEDNRRMRFPRNLILSAVAVSISLSPAAVGKTKEFVVPEVHPAATYPAHDEHKDERVTIAIDPYDTPEKEATFSVPYREHDLLPLRLIVTNDGDEPITFTDLQVQLITAHRTKITAATNADLYRRISHPQRNDRPRVKPLPWPRGKMKGTVSQQVRDELDRAQFAARAVEPHSTRAGFVFFDLEGISTPLTGAVVDVTGAHNAKGGELLYFEIPLDSYLNPESGPK